MIDPLDAAEVCRVIFDKCGPGRSTRASQIAAEEIVRQLNDRIAKINAVLYGEGAEPYVDADALRAPADAPPAVPQHVEPERSEPKTVAQLFDTTGER